jgi:hypothetical protein
MTKYESLTITAAAPEPCLPDAEGAAPCVWIDG